MLNGILTALLIFSVVTAAFTGRMEALSAAALSGCGEAVSLAIALTGMLCLWSGLMEIARRCRLTEALARLLHPLTRWLFPTVPQGSPAMQAICMNLSANLLGLGNAATPLGLAAMRELQKLNPHKTTASNAMVTFVAMNTASLQLIPTTCAALRQQAGSAAPMEILPAVWLTGLSSLAVVLLLDRLLRGKSRRPEKRQARAGGGRPQGKPPLPGGFGGLRPPAPAQPERSAGALHPIREFHQKGGHSMSFSAWFIPLLITGLFSWGLCSGVDVFDCFLQGAKEGLKTAASITPALVCLLTVVTMFCHSGALDVLTGFLRPVTQLIGFPAEVLPLALLRPVSGSGGTALLHQLLGEYGPDSFIGRVGSVLAAASETTFYAIAVYYGAVGIRRTRHTMAAALTGDLTAALVSALAVRLLLGV